MRVCMCLFVSKCVTYKSIPQPYYTQSQEAKQRYIEQLKESGGTRKRRRQSPHQPQSPQQVSLFSSSSSCSLIWLFCFVVKEKETCKKTHSRHH